MNRKFVAILSLMLAATLLLAIPFVANATKKHGTFRSAVAACLVCGEQGAYIQYACSTTDWAGWVKACAQAQNCTVTRDNQGTCWNHDSCHSDTKTYNRHLETHTVCKDLGCQYP